MSFRESWKIQSHKNKEYASVCELKAKKKIITNISEQFERLLLLDDQGRDEEETGN